MIRPIFILSAFVGAFLLSPAAVALSLQLPSNARLVQESALDPDSYRIPTGVAVEGVVPVKPVEGRILRQAWQIDIVGQSTLQIIAPLRNQLETAGFEILFECQAKTCGGFDFRFEIEVIDAPDMHVDLFDYRFLTAQSGTGDTAEYVTLLVSRSSVAGFVQLFHVSPAGKIVNTTITADATPQDTAPIIALTGETLSMGQALEQNGHVVLSDLRFQTGSSKLGNDDFPSLAKLAAYLLANPKRRVALVGHTDSQGSLAANIALSKRRAASVVERLAKAHNVPREQMTGEGMGYLSPRTANLTQAGRETNRRVEVVLLNIE